MAVLVVGIPVFGLESPAPANVPALLLAPLPFLMWAAVRLGVGGTGLTLLIVAGIALANAYVGRGPFISQAPDVNVFSLQIFLTAISIPILLLAALVEERRQAEESLKQTSKRAKLALAERSLQFALAGKAALVGSYAYDVDTDMMQVDAGYAALHGLPEGTVQTTRGEWRGRTHPNDVSRVEDMREQAFGEGLGEYASEYRILRSGGEVRWIESRSFITYTSEGRPQRVAGVNIDITERKRIGQTLAERKAQLELANNIAQVGSYTYNYATRILWLGPGSASIYGLRENGVEMTAEEWRKSVHPDDVAQLVAESRAALANRQCELVCVFRILRQGEVRWIETRNRHFYDKTGRATQAIGVSIDITERRRAEDHKGLLVAELDHRVKNALACVAAIAQHAREGSNTLDEFLDGFNGRIQSLANTHVLLSRTCWRGVSLAALVHGELSACMKDDNTDIQGPDIDLVAEATQPIAMVLHELATNAGKYGALSNSQGRVSVCWDWQLNGGSSSGLILEWRETGGPPVVAPRTNGYGSTVIRDLIPYELGGTVDFVLAPDGVSCKLAIPAKWLSHRTQPLFVSPSAPWQSRRREWANE
jgi:PAS domain S-box-containing protein